MPSPPSPSAFVAGRRDAEAAARAYGLYGVTVRSEIPLDYLSSDVESRTDVTLSLRDEQWFSDAARSVVDLDVSCDWCECGTLPDGADFLRWPSLFEFVVSADGRHVYSRPLENATPETLQNYLLGAVMSFALVRLGLEPLHATAVVVDGKAVALLGASGYGKSTLAASFLQAGHKLVTDDLLLMRQVRGVWQAYPGPPRLKLFPEVAGRLQPHKMTRGVMNPDTYKLMMPVDRSETTSTPVPIERFVLLDPFAPSGTVPGLEPLSPRESFVALVGATFNTRLQSPTRLQRQFALATVWAGTIGVRRVIYTRDLDALHTVRDAIVDDLRASVANS